MKDSEIENRESKSETPTVVYYPTVAEPLTREELVRTIGTAMESQAKLAQALRQLLAERLARATTECAEPRLAEREAGHAGGRAAEILSLQGELQNCLRSALALKAQKPEKRK